MIAWKAVKPAKLKEDVFRLEFLSAVHKAEREIKKRFQGTTKGFKHEVIFESLISLKGGPSVYVYTNDQIYQWLNDGTPPHDIPAKDDGLLSFQVGYTSKTVPGSLTTRAGSKFGPRIRKKIVHHPGFEARDFDKMIEEEYRPRFKKLAEEAMRNAARKCGHYAGAA
ncbi:MAG TPA: hypothetical protein VJ044_14760 [Candidatus Hodarchaeales archaeon]|nr:hypothetical protein [Candidatus Hodarchaeales archaeon]